MLVKINGASLDIKDVEKFFSRGENDENLIYLNSHTKHSIDILDTFVKKSGNTVIIYWEDGVDDGDVYPDCSLNNISMRGDGTLGSFFQQISFACVKAPSRDDIPVADNTEKGE